MKKVTLCFLTCLFFFYSHAQNNNAISVRSIDSIFRAIKKTNKLTKYTDFDSSGSKFFYVDRKSKKLLSAEIFNHNYYHAKRKILDYDRFIYYFHNDELIKLFVIHCSGKRDCKKGVFYFSNGKVIEKQNVLTDDSYLIKPLEFLQDFKSFINKKNN